MKIVLIALLTIVSTATFAADKEKARNPAAAAPAGVKATADQLKRETRTRISSYMVSAEEANPCSEEGLHYNIKLQVKKAQIALDKNGSPTVKHKWETVREVDTDANGNPMEICLE